MRHGILIHILDTLSLLWSQKNYYTFPPFLMMLRVLKQDVTQKSAFSHLQSTMLAKPDIVLQYFLYASSQASLHKKLQGP